jgi:hypothetical protein
MTLNTIQCRRNPRNARREHNSLQTFQAAPVTLLQLSRELCRRPSSNSAFVLLDSAFQDPRSSTRSAVQNPFVSRPVPQNRAKMPHIPPHSSKTEKTLNFQLSTLNPSDLDKSSRDCCPAKPKIFLDQKVDFPGVGPSFSPVSPQHAWAAPHVCPFRRNSHFRLSLHKNPVCAHLCGFVRFTRRKCEVFAIGFARAEE